MQYHVKFIIMVIKEEKSLRKITSVYYEAYFNYSLDVRLLYFLKKTRYYMFVFFILKNHWEPIIFNRCCNYICSIVEFLNNNQHTIVKNALNILMWSHFVHSVRMYYTSNPNFHVFLCNEITREVMNIFQCSWAPFKAYFLYNFKGLQT